MNRSLVAAMLAALAGACGRSGFAPLPDGRAGSGADDANDGSTPSVTGMISAGHAHTCAIVDTALWCWGANLSGQLGLGMTGVPMPSPQRVTGEWRAVAVGEVHTCALDVMGDVWCWGGNGFGQLGVGDMNPRLSPTRVATPSKVIQLASRSNHVCVVLETQVLNCWGRNAEGEIALADPFDANSRRLVPTPPAINDRAGVVFAGYAHTLWVRTDGSLWGAGRNTVNEIGRGDSATFAQHRTFAVISTEQWLRASGGQNCTCAIKADFSLWCWGSNGSYELGLGDLNPRPVPTLVESGAWTDVDVDTFHGCGIRDGSVKCWGRAIEGQLSRDQDPPEPLPIVTDPFNDYIDVDVGRFYSCARRASGSVWCTGKGEDGVLGVGDVNDRFVWTKVPIPGT